MTGFFFAGLMALFVFVVAFFADRFRSDEPGKGTSGHRPLTVVTG
jgi:hypothetical protein